MKILVLFATYSGGTQIVADTIEKTLLNNGHSVTKQNPKLTTVEDISSSDIIILCSPSWDVNGKDGQPHEDFFSLIERAKNSLFEGKQFAIVGLGDSSYPHFCGAVAVLESFVSEKRGTLKSPSLRIDGFFYDEPKHTKTIDGWIHTVI
jgi:flavodoxin I